MILPFNEKVVNNEEISEGSLRRPNFVGYLNPKGEEINYALPFGRGGHNNNPTTELFQFYFYIRYQEYRDGNFVCFGDRKPAIKNEKEFVKIRLKELRKNVERLRNKNLTYRLDKYNLMDYDLLCFFKNCYDNGIFNDGFGKYVRLISDYKFSEEFMLPIYEKRKKLYPREKNEKFDEYNNRIPINLQFDYQYEKYIDSMILDLLKEVFISYMGYHSVERTPRTITTSSFKIYETFYNYLLNDFTIYQLPKMIYDNEKKMYIENKQNEFLIPDSELRFKEEIESIRKRVPLEERSKYYR